MFNNPELKIFLEKGYGLELLTKLYSASCSGDEIHVSKLYDDIKLPKPNYPAFRRYLERMEAADKVRLVTSSCKRSRKIVTLSKHFYDDLNNTSGELLLQLDMSS